MLKLRRKIPIGGAIKILGYADIAITNKVYGLGLESEKQSFLCRFARFRFRP